MAYDGMYGDLSTRGAANEVLNLAIVTKEQILAAASEVAADQSDVTLKALQVAADSAAVAASRAQVTADAAVVANDRQVVETTAVIVQSNADAVAAAVAAGLLIDSPKDGKNYSRNNGTWVEDQTTLVKHLTGTLFDFLKTGAGRVVNTIADLKALSKNNNNQAFVLGYYAAGDGGGGHYRADLTDTTSSDNNGTVIVATDATRWKLQYGKSLDANQFGIMGDGVDRTARMLALASLIAGMTMKPALVYSCSASGGNYVYNQSANYAIEGLRLHVVGDVKFTNTGTGYAFIIDVGLTGAKVGNFRIASSSNPLIIRGGSSTGGGVYVRGAIEDFNVHIRCHGCGTSSAGLRTEWVVGGILDFCATPMDRSTGVLAWYQGGKPAVGISLGRRAVGEQTCYNVFPNCITNACGTGKYLEETLGNVFIGGDSEYCTSQGVLIETTGLNDLFLKNNFEVNPTDIANNGYCINFENCDSVLSVFGANSRSALLHGGNWGAITVASGANNTNIDSINYSRGLGSETITDNGTKTRRVGNMNLATGIRENQPKKISTITVPTGTFTYTNPTANNLGVHIVGGTINSVTLYVAGQAFIQPTPGGTTGAVTILQPGDQIQIISTAAPTMKLIEGY